MGHDVAWIEVDGKRFLLSRLVNVVREKHETIRYRLSFDLVSDLQSVTLQLESNEQEQEFLALVNYDKVAKFNATRSVYESGGIKRV